MTQRDRDRLVVLKKTKKKLIKQSQAAKELDISPRQVRRLLRRLREQGDAAVIHALRGRPSNRRGGGGGRPEELAGVAAGGDWGFWTEPAVADRAQQAW